MKLRDFVPPVFSRSSRQATAPTVNTGITGCLHDEVQAAKILAARALIQQMRFHAPPTCLADAEFKVFSQFGDDGIIQYLIHALEIESRTFVEFGVEDYSEANTRFLLINDNWRGLIMDGSEKHLNHVRQDSIYWRHDLTAVDAFISRENINGLLEKNGFVGDLGLLSVDIDGNDYWVWESISCVQPTIVIVEYNSVFGGERAVTIPYDPTFFRTTGHYSNLYWGASLKALCLLAEKKGYALVGCNSNGNNAYFVLKDKLGPLKSLTAEQGYVESRFRESRDRQGNLTFLRGDQRRLAIAEMPLMDVESGTMITVRDLDAKSSTQAA